MLPVKLLRSLVLGEAMNNPFHHNDGVDDPHAHDADDEDDDDDDDAKNHHHLQRRALKEEKLRKKKDRKRLPLLLFTPTGELISDTFRLAAIARDIGMDFHPTPSLSHLIFAWPTSSSSSSTPSTLSSSSSSCCLSSWASSSTPSTSSPFDTHRPSVSSTTSSMASLWTSLLPNDAVPLPFPALSSPTTSLSLLRYFVSLSKGLFRLVFFNFDPDSEIQTLPHLNWHLDFNYRSYCHDSDGSPPLFLHSRVSARRVGSMDDFSKELAGYGWTLFRTRENPKCKSSSSSSELVYLFRKKELNRVRVRAPGECRVRELRLPALDFKSAVPLRILLYILLMTDDVFYLA